MSDEPPDTTALREAICAQAETLTVSAREIVRHFQVLRSARAPRLMMDAPGLFYPDLDLYVISKAGAHRGHAVLYTMIAPLLPAGRFPAYGFVLYPESYVRSCLDRLLRKTVRPVCAEMRVSFENVFNKKHHPAESLTDGPVLRSLIALLRADLGLSSPLKNGLCAAQGRGAELRRA